MKKIQIIAAIMAAMTMGTLPASAQETDGNKQETRLKKVYDENIDPIQQIENAVAKAKTEQKHVICQVGGNWCPWCLRFADFITNDTDISKVIDTNYIYIHVNYNPRKSEGAEKNQQAKAML
ncbi:MAG: thioredoxin family protein, partial [Bacteroidaceae bacterium]|nr:thioredoxin family protein [Bacteroidaceae bacterium]